MPAKKKADAEQAELSSFEEIVTRLETLVGTLEEGEVPLEKALEAFEEGVGLSRKGAALLDAAEARLEVLLQGGEKKAVEDVEEVGAVAGAGSARGRSRTRQAPSPPPVEETPPPPSDDDLPF